MSRTSATYLYCLVQGARPRLSPRARGLPGADEPRLLRAAEDLWLVVSDAPLDLYGEKAIARGLKDLDWVARCAVGHQGVMEGLRGARAVVPMKLFTLFTSDERAMRHVAGSSRQIGEILGRVQGCEEWGVRMTLGATKPARAMARSARPAGGGPGTQFLLQKKRQREEAREKVARAREEAERLFGELGAAAVEARRREARPGEPPAPGLLLEGAFLVRGGGSRAFRARARSLARKAGRAGVQVALSGPWPPYSFSETSP